MYTYMNITNICLHDTDGPYSIYIYMYVCIYIYIEIYTKMTIFVRQKKSLCIHMSLNILVTTV